MGDRRHWEYHLRYRANRRPGRSSKQGQFYSYLLA